ncbi:MAG: hypothetical protein A2790_07695 [Phenylobacterium sp. RIFCSPHIGHO2_01_FULL_69_31]|uniref:DUF167 family protein n=1 Tax=unclassified Phenylobacterium TaxID=2640670 RepID=UPI0008CF47A7|nr:MULTISPECIES: DUF167 family protein [unclassified Phenylobacterium]OHB29894.1 MAG: hypothetical protein A2790_07695 [Phenylobacterium sp. RIFCSPHIGHO2_01_FULL_69_31]
MTRLAVRVTPRGGRDAVDGWMTDAEGRPVLKLRVSAAAADGAANAAVIALVAKTLKLPKSAVRIASGETARVKRLEIDATGADLAAAFGNPP